MTALRHLSLTVLLVSLSALLVKSDKNYYRAAVLELAQFGNISYPPGDILKINLDVYERVAKVAGKNDVDILVYPESGLLPFDKPNREWLKGLIEDIPEADGKVNPCVEDENATQPILKRLSCMARFNYLFLVANTADYKNCDICDNCTCPPDGHYIFNTNVVFDRRGFLIAKYYKRHLYFEPEMNTPPYPQDTYFKTDFGNFTTVICFDLMFGEPVKALQKPGVLNVAYPTYWFDHVPFIYFATPFQQAWAMGNRVNLLAANGHHGVTGSLGSGIYSSSRGALIYTGNPDGRGKLLISNVPKYPREQSANNIPLNQKRFIIERGAFSKKEGVEIRNFSDVCSIDGLKEPPIDSPTEYRCGATSVAGYKFAKLEGRTGSLDICHGGVCCSLDYQADSMKENYYLGCTGLKLNFYDSTLFGTQSCFLARCDDIRSKKCSNYILRSNTTFRKAVLTANFSTNHVYPFALDSEIRLTDRNLWYFKDLRSISETTIDYENKHDDTSKLIFLGLYGRLYDLDQVIENNNGNNIGIDVHFTLPISVFITFYSFIRNVFWKNLA